jgi:hypothetical protein
MDDNSRVSVEHLSLLTAILCASGLRTKKAVRRALDILEAAHDEIAARKEKERQFFDSLKPRWDLAPPEQRISIQEGFQYYAESDGRRYKTETGFERALKKHKLTVYSLRLGTTEITNKQDWKALVTPSNWESVEVSFHTSKQAVDKLSEMLDERERELDRNRKRKKSRGKKKNWTIARGKLVRKTGRGKGKSGLARQEPEG